MNKHHTKWLKLKDFNLLLTHNKLIDLTHNKLQYFNKWKEMIAADWVNHIPFM